MSNHTPGPWKFYTNRGIISEVEINNVGEPIIISHGVRYPHGYLVAAAPEMLEALENILETGLPRNRQAAEKAIAKAKGETG